MDGFIVLDSLVVLDLVDLDLVALGCLAIGFFVRLFLTAVGFLLPVPCAAGGTASGADGGADGVISEISGAGGGTKAGCKLVSAARLSRLMAGVTGRIPAGRLLCALNALIPPA